MRGKKACLLVLGILLLVVTSLVFSNLGCGTNDSDTDSSSTTTSKFTFYSLHSSIHEYPVVKEMISQGISLAEKRSNDHHGLIIDAKQITADEIRNSTVIRDFIKKEKAVLLLNVTNEHKKAMIKHIGISFSNVETPGYCIIPTAKTSARQITIIEHPRVIKLNLSNFESGSEYKVNSDEGTFNTNQEEYSEYVKNTSGPRKFIASVIKYLQENEDIRKGKQGEDNIPDEAKYYRWRYIPEFTYRMDNIWMEEKMECPPYGPCISVFEICNPAPSPMQGYQTGGYSPTIYFSLYLDNYNNITGDFQWLVVDHEGIADPAIGPNSSDSVDTVQMPIDGEKYKMINGMAKLKGYGWGQLYYFFQLDPLFDVEDFHLNLTSPENQVSSTNYTCGYSFNVGYSYTGKKRTVSSSFTVSKSTTVSIPDWEVANYSNLDKCSFLWEWYSKNPYYNDPKMVSMNDCMKKPYQPYASGILQTKKVVSGVKTFRYGFGTKLLGFDGKIYSDIGIHEGNMGKMSFMPFKPEDMTETVDIDFGIVLTPGLLSLSIYPDSVTGGNDVTGTVTLDKPAGEGGVVVTLRSSNQSWASFPEADPETGIATVTVPEGVASETFTINTNSVTVPSEVTITADLNGVTQNAKFVVNPQ